ncbi:transporter substrate-binding domain-containing protein [Pelomonas sp. V22]|uniref:substrate-binding periplasmic protein n=1 Tax=Pelomonas sp. V22 TaxID=2822139 RepID=UPI0024A9D2B8|nr:transporter substrate-binding domain-containing protein [Pelomonas sp. V22]MDI4632638.1 transporter substrate-binding domain-containing protein [Pelomonas sp. V22]
MNRRALPLLASLLPCLALPAARADEIVLASPDFWCPFSCKAGDPLEGFTVDIIRAIFGPAGHQVRLVNENYSRALLDVRAGRYTATPSTFRDEAPDFVLPEQPISRNRYCVYVLPQQRWTYTGPGSLRGKQVGIVRNYSYGSELDRLIKAQPKQFDVHAGDGLTERMLRRLEVGRIDAFIEDENLVTYTLRQKPELKARSAGCEAPTYAFMAISPQHPKAQAYARLFSEGMLQLRRTGQLREILARYGLPEWPLPGQPAP